jgi:hypothetical protein
MIAQCDLHVAASANHHDSKRDLQTGRRIGDQPILAGEVESRRWPFLL